MQQVHAYLKLHLDKKGSPTMRKTPFLIGAGVGFVVGSRAGERPYQWLQMKMHQVGGRPAGQNVADMQTGACAVASPRVSALGEPSREEPDEMSTDESTRVGAPGEPAARSALIGFHGLGQNGHPEETETERDTTLDALLELNVSPAQIDEMKEDLRQTGNVGPPEEATESNVAGDRS
jgi:hypothetical protein